MKTLYATTRAGGWNAVLDDFLLHSSSTLARNTWLLYRSQLTALVAWAALADIPMEQFSARDLRHFLAWRESEGVSRNSLRVGAVVVKRFFAWATSEKYLRSNSLKDTAVPRGEKVFTDVPTPAQAQELLSACHNRWLPRHNPGIVAIGKDRREFYRHRNYAILSGFLFTGLRSSEMLALELRDIQPDGDGPGMGRVVVRKSKSHEPRLVPLHPDWKEPLAAWMRVRPARVNSPLLFFSDRGGPVSYRAYVDQFRADLEFAALPHFRLHSLRHFAATAIGNVNPEAARRMLGHADLRTTQIYLHSQTAIVRDAIEIAPAMRGLLVNKRSRPRII